MTGRLLAEGRGKRIAADRALLVVVAGIKSAERPALRMRWAICRRSSGELRARRPRKHEGPRTKITLSGMESNINIMGLMAKNITLRFTLVYSISEQERDKVLEGISLWLKQTQPIFNIASQFELKDIIKAHELVESGKKIGHVLLTIPH
jgi:hypothetical protein